MYYVHTFFSIHAPHNFCQVLLWERERDRMVHQEGVLMDVSYASREAFRGMVDFANTNQGLLWSSPLEDQEEEDEGGGGSGSGGLAGRKKLLVIAPSVVEGLNAAILQNSWSSAL